MIVSFRRTNPAMKLILRFAFQLFVFACACLPLAAQSRFRPEDLFRVRRPGAMTWSPDSRYAAIELSRPGRALDGAPSAEIGLIDVKARAMTIVSSSAPAYLGFFNAIWSPGGRRLAFLSVDAKAVVRVWIWRPGTPATIVRSLDVHVGFLDSPIIWIDDDRLGSQLGSRLRGNSVVSIFPFSRAKMPLTNGRMPLMANRQPFPYLTRETRINKSSRRTRACGQLTCGPAPEPCLSRVISII